MTSQIPGSDWIPNAGETELVPFIPERNTNFRLARLLLLLDAAREHSRQVASIDRLAYYEFFADNPFIVIDGNKSRDQADRATIELAGFSRIQLGYASSGQRFLSRRRRLRHDLAHLVALGLVTLGSTGYLITERGAELVGQFRSIYADAYRQSAEIILRRLVPLSGTRLEAKAEEWLGHSWLLVDLLDDIKDAEVPPVPRPS
ncbi:MULTISPECIES: hypothetical protein [Rhodococcus]|uniref:Uncharacterized protein n=1 Tax=Rhodococcus parequi TaxID=3137122 RepID=A0ABW9FH03_9NOCA